MQKNAGLPQPGERLAALDVAKGIGMILVVFTHVNYTPILQQLIYSFHMPLFFVLAGMVFCREKFPSLGAFVKRRWKSLVLPYLAFSVFSVVYVFASEKIWAAAEDLRREEYLQAFLQIFLAQGSGPVLNTPLWFVPCLLAVEILYYGISGQKRVVGIPVCALLMAFGWLLESGLLPFDNTKLPWTLDSAFFALGFYASGHLLAPWLRKTIAAIRQHPRRNWLCVAVIVGCLILWLPLALGNGKISLGSRILNNGFLLYLTGMLGTFAVLAVSILLEKCRPLIFLGRNTFCMMAVHYMIRKFAMPKYYKMLGIKTYNSKSLGETVIPFLIVLTLSILVAAVYDRLFHKKRKKPAPENKIA